MGRMAAWLRLVSGVSLWAGGTGVESRVMGSHAWRVAADARALEGRTAVVAGLY